MKVSKNIHVLPTDKPSRLLINWEKDLCYKSKPYLMEGTQNIYITSDEEIKEGYYLDLTHNIVMKSVFYPSSDKNCKKIILTTDQDLIKDGVQAIDDEFLEWFVKNPSCEEVEVIKLYNDTCKEQILNEYEIIIPKEEPRILTVEAFNKAKISYKEPKQETLEQIDQTNPVTKGSTALVYKQETLEEFINKVDTPADFDQFTFDEGIRVGAKWQQEQDKNKYSEEEVLEILKKFYQDNNFNGTITEWFEQNKKK
jgi:hypothetical protein